MSPPKARGITVRSRDSAPWYVCFYSGTKELKTGTQIPRGQGSLQLQSQQPKGGNKPSDRRQSTNETWKLHATDSPSSTRRKGVPIHVTDEPGAR